MYGEMLRGLTPLGFALGSQKFFEPNSRFTEFMKPFIGRRIFDVGAGMGHVTKFLQKEGHAVYPIDCAVRDGAETDDVIIADATTFPYPKDTVLLICRPCHGIFVQHVLVQAELAECNAVIYVGLQKNVDDDLGLMRKLFRLEASGVGEANEVAYVWPIADRRVAKSLRRRMQR